MYLLCSIVCVCVCALKDTLFLKWMFWILPIRTELQLHQLPESNSFGIIHPTKVSAAEGRLLLYVAKLMLAELILNVQTTSEGALGCVNIWSHFKSNSTNVSCPATFHRPLWMFLDPSAVTMQSVILLTFYYTNNNFLTLSYYASAPEGNL